MQTFLATVVDGRGGIIIRNVAVKTLIPVRPSDPTWSGSFPLPNDLASPPKAGDQILLRIPAGDDLLAVVVGICLGEVYFNSVLAEGGAVMPIPRPQAGPG